MNSFKEVIAQDISAIFLNEKEFADTYNIDARISLPLLIQTLFMSGINAHMLSLQRE